MQQTRTEDYAEVPWWLGEAYPSLFEYPRQIDRVRIYSIAYDVRDLLASPPTVPPRHLPELHAYHRLAARGAPQELHRRPRPRPHLTAHR